MHFNFVASSPSSNSPFKKVIEPLNGLSVIVVVGLDFLHRFCNIIHTDLKPENILVQRAPVIPSPEALADILAIHDDRQTAVAIATKTRKEPSASGSVGKEKKKVAVETVADILAATGLTDHLEHSSRSKKSKKKLKKRRQRAGGGGSKSGTLVNNSRSADKANATADSKSSLRDNSKKKKRLKKS